MVRRPKKSVRKKRTVRAAARSGAALVVPASKPRNPVARSPLLRKGGAHAKTEQAERKRAKDALVKALRRGDEP